MVVMFPTKIKKKKNAPQSMVLPQDQDYFDGSPGKKKKGRKRERRKEKRKKDRTEEKSHLQLQNLEQDEEYQGEH